MSHVRITKRTKGWKQTLEQMGDRRRNEEGKKRTNFPDLQRVTVNVIGIFCTIVLNFGNAAKQQ